MTDKLSDDGLPALPGTAYQLYYEWPDDEDGYGGSEVIDSDGYSADQMREYARTAVAAALATKPPAGEQKPVARVRTWTKNGEGHGDLVGWLEGVENLPDGEYDLYLTPHAQPEQVAQDKIDAEHSDSLLSDLVTIYFDGTENPEELRAYVNGAFPKMMAEARTVLRERAARARDQKGGAA